MNNDTFDDIYIDTGICYLLFSFYSDYRDNTVRDNSISQLSLHSLMFSISACKLVIVCVYFN